jgi:hypothetical protein
MSSRLLALQARRAALQAECALQRDDLRSTSTGRSKGFAASRP